MDLLNSYGAAFRRHGNVFVYYPYLRKRGPRPRNAFTGARQIHCAIELPPALRCRCP